MTTLGFNTLYAQSDEELLAQAFLKDVDKLPRKVYIVADVGSTLLIISRESLLDMLCEWQLCDTTLANELFMSQDYNPETTASWDRNATALANPRFKNVVFVKEEGGKAHKLLTKGKPVWYITKPIYNNQSYALVSRVYHTYMRKLGFKISDYYILLKKVDSIWVEVGKKSYRIS